MDARVIFTIIGIIAAIILMIYIFSGGSDHEPAPPVIVQENLCQQKEEPYQKDYLVANYIDHLRLNDNYTDIDIIAQNQTVRGHKVFLASHSQYFDSSIWLKSEPSANEVSNSSQMNIEFIDFRTLVIIFNYMYTTSLPDDIFNNETAYGNLMKAADELQMDSLKCEISKRLSNRLNTKNAGIIVALADETNTNFLMVVASKYLLDNFKAISQTDEWKRVIKDHQDVLTNAIDFNGKLPNNTYCDIKCIPATMSSPSVFTRLRRCFFSQRFVDGEIHMLDGSDKVFQVNRAILIGQSPLFRQQFATANAIHVNATTAAVMEEFLAYMYSGWPTQKMKKMAEGLLYLSTTYEMKPLQEACENILVGDLNIQNAVKLIIIADQANSKRLFSVVLDFILKHRKEVVATKDWAELKEKHPEILTKIFSN